MHITNSVIRELVNSKPEQHTFKHVSMSFYISIYTGFMYTCKDFCLKYGKYMYIVYNHAER